MRYDIQQARALASTCLGGELPQDMLARVFDFAHPLAFEKGQNIFGDTQAFLLLSGIVRGYYLDREGNDITHIFILENQLHRASFLTSEKPHVCNFEALEDCVALHVNMRLLADATLESPALLRSYVHELEQALSRKIMRETSLIAQSATERYLALLRDYPGIEARVSQAHIASYLGIKPASLSRIRRVIRQAR